MTRSMIFESIRRLFSLNTIRNMSPYKAYKYLAPSNVTVCMFYGLICFYFATFNIALQLFGLYEFSLFSLDISHLDEPKCSGCGRLSKTNRLINTYRDDMIETSMWLTLVLLCGCTISGWALYEGARIGKPYLVKIFVFWKPVTILGIISLELINYYIKLHDPYHYDLITWVIFVLLISLGIIAAYRLCYRRLYLSPSLARVLGVDRDKRMTVVEVISRTHVYLDNLGDNEFIVIDHMLVEQLGGEHLTRGRLGKHLEKLMSDELVQDVS